MQIYKLFLKQVPMGAINNKYRDLLPVQDINLASRPIYATHAIRYFQDTQCLLLTKVSHPQTVGLK
jgi:hypothetical protein